MSLYRVLLFYHYTNIPHLEDFREEHLQYTKSLGLLGRIFISHEGINGTVSGTVDQTNTYMDMLSSLPFLHGISFKIDEAHQHAFKKMHVRIKNELVNFSLEDDINPTEMTGRYIEPEEFLANMSDPDTLIIDARNHYEFNVGHFKGALLPEIETFRELPAWIRANKNLLKGKKIMTYCTGGVRCEKFSGWLIREGFEDVGQLHGGIVTYGKHEKTRGKNWDGQCYVFDNRLTVPINVVNPSIIGRDHFSGEPCERYINCANPECNKQILCSVENEKKYLGSCSDACRLHPKNRYILGLKSS